MKLPAPEIFVIDDDPQLRSMMEAQLGARGYRVSCFANGVEGLDALTRRRPNLIILDIMMPQMDGMEMCRQVRKWSEIPVILLTCTDSHRAKIEALNMGADDYLTKPFHMGELVARIGAVMRRSRITVPESPELTIADIQIDLMSREVRRGEDKLTLTKTEFDLLAELVKNPGQALTYQQLFASVWGHQQADPHLVQVHMANLRRKIDAGSLASRLIRAVPGIGYRLDVP